MEVKPNRSKLKIAFVGTSCTGKTEILNHYKQVYAGDTQVAFVEEAARDFFKAHPRIKHRFSETTQTQVQDLVFSRELAAHIQNPILIFTERSVFDAVPYTAAGGSHLGAEKLLDKAFNWLPTYGHKFLLDPKDVPYKSDEIRIETEFERMRIHKYFIALFERNSIPYMMLSGTLEQRVAFIDQVIKRGQGRGFNPINPRILSETESRHYRQQKNEITYPHGERASSISYRGAEPLLQFVREGRLGIGAILRVYNYERGQDPHFQIVKNGLAPYNFEPEKNLYQPEEVLNTQVAHTGWSIDP